ncbi:blight resistance protein RGA3-like [Oryza sativa Japonica Group]|uniref:Blight resistance protein RGA3-like n=1 Tax=Oryza sativa subsp. japonica TaxID=39947 RepID=Q5JMV1_ORYSJ|nr:blight resistance protein RGA3-like [Oryza sativa Japonica Group]
MAVEVVQFLVRKFVDSLAEEEEAAAELPFRAHFYDVKAELEKAAISSTNDDELRQCLYELNDLLAECRLLANRTNMRPGCFSPSEAWRSNSLKKRVIAVKRRVLRSVESDSSGVGGNAAALEEEDSAATGFSRWTSSWIEEGTVQGFDQQLAELESVAECGAGGLTGVGIVGMGGVGKTGLAQLVFNSLRAMRRGAAAAGVRPRGQEWRRPRLSTVLISAGERREQRREMKRGGRGGDCNDRCQAQAVRPVGWPVATRGRGGQQLST